MEGGQDVPRQDAAQEQERRIETADGDGVFLFRYDNPEAPNRNPDSEVSREGLVGRWFTDSPHSLKTHIRNRPPGGNVVVVEVPKSRLEELRAINKPELSDMDIEPDNYVLPDELMEGARSFPVTVSPSTPKRYKFGDWEAIDTFVDGITTDLNPK